MIRYSVQSWRGRLGLRGAGIGARRGKGGQGGELQTRRVIGSGEGEPK